MIRTILAQDTEAEAFARWDKVADALRDRHDKPGAPMDASREDVLACYMDYPEEHWARIASASPLERVDEEIERRADVVGIFPNDGAVIRLVSALMLEQSDEWAVSGRYFSPESLARLADTHPPSAARRGSPSELGPELKTGAPTPPAGTRPGRARKLREAAARSARGSGAKLTIDSFGRHLGGLPALAVS